MKIERDISLDAMRGIAALVVFGSHSVLAFYPEFSGYLGSASVEDTARSRFWYAAVNGQGAVAFFFVLSGFVLSRPYLLTGRKEHSGSRRDQAVAAPRRTGARDGRRPPGPCSRAAPISTSRRLRSAIPRGSRTSPAPIPAPRSNRRSPRRPYAGRRPHLSARRLHLRQQSVDDGLRILRQPHGLRARLSARPGARRSAPASGRARRRRRSIATSAKPALDRRSSSASRWRPSCPCRGTPGARVLAAAAVGLALLDVRLHARAPLGFYAPRDRNLPTWRCRSLISMRSAAAMLIVAAEDWTGMKRLSVAPWGSGSPASCRSPSISSTSCSVLGRRLRLPRRRDRRRRRSRDARWSHSSPRRLLAGSVAGGSVALNVGESALLLGRKSGSDAPELSLRRLDRRPWRARPSTPWRAARRAASRPSAAQRLSSSSSS